MTAIPFKQQVVYPESDGQPMGETERHVLEMVELLNVLRERYSAAADVYVGGNLFLYYTEGDARSVVCPDVFVVHGVPKLPPRRIYKLWEEGTAPSLVVELTSESTAREDLGRKRELYARLGVAEYFLFDPWGEELSPRLQGLRLDGRRYRPIEPAADGSLESTVLGLRLLAEGSRLRLIDPATGEPLPRYGEARRDARQEKAARREAEAARLREQAAREAAEAARREAEAARLREQAAREAAEAARREAEAAREAAEARAAAADEELAHLRREIERQAAGDGRN